MDQSATCLSKTELSVKPNELTRCQNCNSADYKQYVNWSMSRIVLSTNHLLESGVIGGDITDWIDQ